MTKTETRILDALQNGSNKYFYLYDEHGGSVPCDGKRAVQAATYLVERGQAAWIREPYTYSYNSSRNGFYGKTRWAMAAVVKLAN